MAPKYLILGKNSVKKKKKSEFDNVAERISLMFHPTLAILMRTDLAVGVGTRSVIHSLLEWPCLFFVFLEFYTLKILTVLLLLRVK